MSIIKVKGIIIGETLYSESSKILKVLTKEYGQISILAKGCRKPKSPFHEACNKLIYSTFDISYKKDGISTLIGIEIINIFKNILMNYKDLEKKTYAFFLIDLTNQIINQREESNEEIFDNLINTLIKINEGLNPKILLMIIKLKYLEYLGVKPNIDSCGNCGSTDNIITISTQSYGYVCKDCYQNEKIVSKETIKMIRMLYYVDISRIKKLEINEQVINEIEEFIDEYYEQNTGIYAYMKDKMKTLAILSSI